MTDVFQQINDFLLSALNSVNGFMGTMLVVVLGVTALWFTIATKGVQFRLIGDMLRLLVRDDDKAIKKGGGKHVSSFQAFMVSIASRVGTGNLAGVATAIVIGGPGAIFWMWVMALIGSANAFIESTLAQLYKIKGKDSFIGGPAYYISKGLKKKWFAVLFAVSIIVCFGFANNIVQSNTISLAYVTAFGVDPIIMSIALTVLTLLIIFGGIQRIAKFSSVVVPVMAVAYLIVSIVIIALHIEKVPEVFMMIVQNAFGYGQVLGGGVGMAIMYGFQRGLFSNEAGEGSAPNVAATATTGHPVK
ncbi:MAG: alanine:cation symporter family protein, partial [Muribaculaceae bacterium]|nr:alanine:cation symporter family protein [Muribaculaceae bacterium]